MNPPDAPDTKPDRRGFLQQSLVGGTAFGLAIASTTHVSAEPTTAAALDPETTNEVDVLVVGGGTAGHVAAIRSLPASAGNW